MDSDNSEKFSFAFFLAILFHLLLLFLLILGVSFEPQITAKNTEVMFASIFEASATENQEEKSAEPVKKLSRREKKQLAKAKKQILRLQQAEKKKLLAAAAQKLLIEETLQAQSFAQEIAQIDAKIKSFWQRPVETKAIACVIQVQLTASGEVKKSFFTKSSGNKLFDDSAKAAVYKARPFQMPTNDKLRQKMQAGILVYFGDK